MHWQPEAARNLHLFFIFTSPTLLFHWNGIILGLIVSFFDLNRSFPLYKIETEEAQNS